MCKKIRLRMRRVMITNTRLQIGVWTRESYEEKYPIPSGFRREEGRDKERACHRDVIRVVAYCSDPVVRNY